MAAAMALMVGGTAGAATDRYREALKQVLFADSASMAIRKSQMKMFVAGALSRSRYGVSSEEALRLEKSLDRYMATTWLTLPCHASARMCLNSNWWGWPGSWRAPT